MDDTMVKCPKCGHDNASSSEECDNCGVTLALVLGNTQKSKPQPRPDTPPSNLEPANLKKCPKCGSAVPESSLECIKCGIIFAKFFEVKERILRETLSDLDRSVLEETTDGEVDQEAEAEKEKVQAELEKAEAERLKIEEQEKAEAERRKPDEAEKSRIAVEKAKKLKKQQEDAAKAKAREKEIAKKEAAEKEEEALPAAAPAEKEPAKASDKVDLQRIAQLEKEAETLRLQTAALKKEKQEYEKAEIVRKEEQEQEKQEVLQRAQESQTTITALEDETQALKKEADALKKKKADLEADATRRKDQDEKEAEQRRQMEAEEQAKVEAVEKERQDAQKRTETILKTVLPKPTMKELLKKYEGEAVGINFDDPAEIKSARLAKVNEDHFSIMVPENELVHTYPYSDIVEIVEGAEGVPIDASGETPTYPVVIRIFHLMVKKKWGFI